LFGAIRAKGRARDPSMPGGDPAGWVIARHMLGAVTSGTDMTSTETSGDGTPAATPLDRFRQLLRIPTISRLDESEVDWPEFDRFVSTVATLYPAVHAHLTREIVAGHSLLYRWSGSSYDDPALLMAHYDVVSATDERWGHAPFGAELVATADGDTEVWARGALDDKGALVSILEAVEASLVRGFVPKRDIYLSFGHNEETTGTGATAIAGLLDERGVHLGFVLDEGGAIVEGIFPGVEKPIAVVGVSEKGIMSVELAVVQEGGHASTPPRLSATARLARAIVRLDSRPFRASFTQTNLEMIRTVGTHARQPYRWLFTHLGLTRGVLLRAFARLGPETNAMVRTTAVVTRLSGSQADNALAETARATVNVRVAIDSSVAAALDHIRRSVHDEQVSVTALHPSEPSPVSPTVGPEWDMLRTTIEATYPKAAVTPYVMLGASDSRHFTGVAEAVYRFSPFEMSTAERGTLHAVGERIRVSTWLRGISFYETLIAKL
jgi:carboxypeptidase PM20D1